MEDLKLPAEKFVEMFTWRCRDCQKEWRWRLGSLLHGINGISECTRCKLEVNIKEGKPAVLEFRCEECKWAKNGIQS